MTDLNDDCPPDVLYASGAIHDDAGPVTSFAALTPAGQAWIDEYGIDGTYIIEDEQLDCVLGCIEAEGLRAKAA